MPPEDITVDKAKFDAVLRRLINSPPTSMEAAKATKGQERRTNERV